MRALQVHLVVHLRELGYKEIFPDLFLSFNRLVSQADGIQDPEQQAEGQHGKREGKVLPPDSRGPECVRPLFLRRRQVASIFQFSLLSRLLRA